ncbi:hypothetical protein NBRC110019_12430 [Neptunitalea chrysea]|uniref:CarboxypepD_reg-like domain-containing protein n=2 Tax=Neptunitalea chrysea TaxID=1647581 RepID=A0A9W6EU62_9FLAO|nr:hypothetical protein NBRC110019_12430 [Neptunitalea chrysea]
MNAQDDERKPLRGKVIYQNVSVEGMNVINTTAETAVSTNEDGEFVINVQPKDILVFTSFNYELTSVEITDIIIDNGRLNIEVNEKITELEDVVITPENREKYLNTKSEEFAAYGKYQYEEDNRTKELVNTSMPTQAIGLQNGLNISNIAKILFKKRDKERKEENKPHLKLSEILLQVYDLEFFVLDLKIPLNKVNEFVYFMDSQPFSRDLLKKENEFLFIDYLVDSSDKFKKQIAEKSEE